jgi:hypothetical protein
VTAWRGFLLAVPCLVASAVPVALNTCVPARWPFQNAASLLLLDDSPINCLLLEPTAWNRDLPDAARRRGLLRLAVLSRDTPLRDAERALQFGPDALVIEEESGASSELRALAQRANRPLVEIATRVRTLQATGPVAATAQGLWPGIRMEKDGATQAGPTGAPWIDTNSGFLRFLRAQMPPETAIWIANKPPEGQIWGPERYLHAIADAAVTGSKWVVSLDRAFAASLGESDARSLTAWQRINGALRFYAENMELTNVPEHSRLAVIEDVPSGALPSGNFVDMIASRHTPSVVLPGRNLNDSSLRGFEMVLNVDPASLSPPQLNLIQKAGDSGVRVMNGPAGWNRAQAGGAVTFDEKTIPRLAEMWKQINDMIGRRNMGVRVFNASGILTCLRMDPTSRALILHLINYTSYPVEAITVHALGRYKTAQLLTPQGRSTPEVYETDDGTGVSLDRISDIGILILR